MPLQYIADWSSSLVAIYSASSTMPKIFQGAVNTLAGEPQEEKFEVVPNPVIEGAYNFVTALPHIGSTIKWFIQSNAVTTGKFILQTQWEQVWQNTTPSTVADAIKKEFTTEDGKIDLDKTMKTGLPSYFENKIVGTHIGTGYTGALLVNDLLQDDMGKAALAMIGVDKEINPINAAVLFGAVDTVLYLPQMVLGTLDWIGGLFSSSGQESQKTYSPMINDYHNFPNEIMYKIPAIDGNMYYYVDHS